MPEQPESLNPVTQHDSESLLGPAPAGVGRFCPECGTQHEPDWKFCRNCGHNFGAAQVHATPTTSTEPPPEPAYYYGAPVAAKKSTNGFAIASMVLGIVWIYGIGSILALVFGYIAKKQIALSNGRDGGGGMATAGIVLGWVEIGLMVVLIIVIGVIAALGGQTSAKFSQVSQFGQP